MSGRRDTNSHSRSKSKSSQKQNRQKSNKHAKNSNSKWYNRYRNRNFKPDPVYFNPIAKAWDHIPVVTKLDKGLLLDGYYDTDHKGFYCIFYDDGTNSLVKWHDPHVKSTRRYLGYVPQALSNKKIQYSKMIDLMSEEYVQVSDVPVTFVGSKKTKVKSSKYPPVGRRLAMELRYFHEQNLTLGVNYTIKNNKLESLDGKSTKEELQTIQKKLLGEYSELITLAKHNIPLYNSPISNVERVAFDIEVMAPEKIFPTPSSASYPVHAIGIYDTQDHAELFLYGIHPSSEQMKIAVRNLGYKPKINMYLDERELIQDFFERIQEYCIHLTYNGDSFDLPYLYQRAKNLGISTKNIPIHKGHFRGRIKEYHITGGIHIDLYRFFSNNAVRLYAFSGKYSSSGLNDVADALLEVKKTEHELWYDKMPAEMLIEYTITDVKLTLKLTTFSNNLTWNLFIVLMRVGKMSLTYLNRESISKWILNWIAFEHEQQGAILPSPLEIKLKKGDFESGSKSSDKQYKGAIVLDPKEAGVFWDVTVADFASLYPSVIKKYNLSYETLRCNHQSCQSNIVPYLSHWVCTKRVGIMAQVVGLVRDARVRWFKPKSNGEGPDAEIAKTIEQALKVFINASYGVFGAKKFDLFCPPVAESTTAYSRHALLEAKRLAEGMGLEVLYGDTDSIFLHEITEEKFQRLKVWSVVQLGIELDRDYNFRFLVMSGRKKNYFGITDTGKLILKGLQVKKRNTAKFIQELFQNTAETMKKVKTEEDLEKAKKEMVRLIRKGIQQLENGTLPLESLAKTATLNMEFKDYRAKSAALQAAIQVMDDDFDSKIKKGHMFSVVSINKREFLIKTSKFPILRKGELMKCSVRDISLIRDYSEVDVEKYKELLKNAFMPIFEPFNLEWSKTVEGEKELDEWFTEKGYIGAPVEDNHRNVTMNTTTTSDEIY